MFILLDQSCIFENLDIIIDVPVTAMKELRQPINAHGPMAVQHDEKVEPLGSYVFEQGLEVVKIYPLNGLFRNCPLSSLLAISRSLFLTLPTISRLSSNLSFFKPPSLSGWP